MNIKSNLLSSLATQSSILLGFALLFFACSPSEPTYQETFVDLSSYQVQDGLQLKPLAAEPLIEAPIDISFDDQGRLWVLEMRGYMQTLEGINEEAPIGRILILQDLDADGQADHTHVFLDSLKLARSISHAYRGLLYAEPPYLWHIAINDDLTPGQKTLVDSAYAIGGNVEHQPNGLLFNIDNWIYNAKSGKRYRKINGDWKIESTAFRGQWGISRDAMGRLIYNHNSSQVRGDQVLPNFLHKPGFSSDRSINVSIVKDQRVYPAQATAVNRGYIPGMLQENGKLVNFTSACGPVYVQGSAMPLEYQGNVLVCAPEANLIKRNVINDQSFTLTGKQAWQDKELIVSTDEGFRPVTLKNGPDGAIYIVDMHRGIIQHKTYMTSYLRDQYIQRGLDNLTGMGRILRLSKSQNPYTIPELSKYPLRELIDSLASKNIWVRDRVQQMIVYSGDLDLVNPLVELLNNSTNEIARIHAFYCLEGLQALSKKQLNINNMIHHPRLLAHVLKMMGEHRLKLTNQALDDLLAQQDSTIDYYLGFMLAKNFNNSAITYLTQILDRYNQSEWIREPIAVALDGDLELFRSSTNGYNTTLDYIAEVQGITPPELAPQVIGEDPLTRGLALYRTHCATCHGPDGKGIRDLAPPLLSSAYVEGTPDLLVNIMLYGLKGPLTINGKSYDFITSMPGLKLSNQISDQELKDIANYIRNAFTTSPQNVTTDLVRELRNQSRPADQSFTTEELKRKYKNL